MELELVLKENVGLIWNIAKRFYTESKNDLYQAGVLGLIKAYQNYKSDGECKFSTYAYKYIYGEMYNVAINKTIKQSKDLIKLVKLVEMTKNKLAQKLMREPSIKEVAEFLEMDEETINYALLSASVMLSLDNGDDDLNLHEVIPCEEKVSVDDRIMLSDSINELDLLEKNIINARYYEDLTQSETAKKLGITQVMVSRYEKRSLKKMKDYMYSR